MALTSEEFAKLGEADKAEYLRLAEGVKGKEDLNFLCREVLGYKEIDAEVHAKLIEVLSDDKQRKLILLPRGAFKSTIATIGNTVHKLLNNPNIRVLIDSEVLENAQKFLGQIKKHMRDPSFVRLYGSLIDKKHRETAREFTVNTRTSQNLKEPSVYATGIGTVNVGMHYDLIIADDLHSEKNVATKEQIEKVISHYRLLLSLLEPGGELIIIGTRWHFYDLYSFLLEEEDSSNWEIYIEKAIRKDGTLFFPKRLTREFLREQRNAQGSYLFSCQYLNEPVSEETQIFRREYFKYWGSAGEDFPKQDGSRILLNIYVLIDRAFSSKESADFTGIVVVGVSTTGNIYVLEAERQKCGLQVLADTVFRFINYYGAGRVRSVGIETINFEESYTFFQEQMRKRNEYFILQRLVPGSKLSKQGRIEVALQARYANGTIYHRRRMIDFEDELLRFPVGTHDDLIDAFAYVVQMMTTPGDPTYETDKIEYRPSGFFGKTGY